MYSFYKANKKIKILFIIFSLISITYFIYYINNIINTTIGWAPPDVSFKLSFKENNWVKKIEKKYDSTFDYIGLDNQFTEDSIIHIILNCHYNAIFEKNKIVDKEKFTKELCKDFFSNSDFKRPQNYISFLYTYIEENKKHTISSEYFYYKNLDSIIKTNETLADI